MAGRKICIIISLNGSNQDGDIIGNQTTSVHFIFISTVFSRQRSLQYALQIYFSLSPLLYFGYTNGLAQTLLGMGVIHCWLGLESITARVTYIVIIITTIITLILKMAKLWLAGCASQSSGCDVQGLEVRCPNDYIPYCTAWTNLIVKLKKESTQALFSQHQIHFHPKWETTLSLVFVFGSGSSRFVVHFRIISCKVNQERKQYSFTL